MKVNKLKRGSKRINIFTSVRNIAVLFCIFAAAAVIYLFSHSHPMQAVFPLKHITFAGNKHLTDDELRTLAGVHLNESLIMISGSKVTRQILKSPWIRSVNLRKEFPDTLSMVIEEAEPFALLDMNEHLFLIDENGKLLEELRDDSIPFLPVITADPFKEKEGFSEALNLVRIMNGKGFSSERDRIEIIAHKAHELTLTIDGTVVKIGAGGYEGKLEKLIRLEEDIKDMGIPVDYIDLRFENKAIVKPVTGKVVK
jgi:cell division protein FtsQ